MSATCGVAWVLAEVFCFGASSELESLSTLFIVASAVELAAVFAAVCFL